MQICLRPDGRLAFDGETPDVGEVLIRLVRDGVPSTLGHDAAAAWFRSLGADHIRRLVEAAEDGRMPNPDICEQCRPDVMTRS